MKGRAGVVALVAVLPLVAVALDPWGWFPFGPAKWLAVSALVPIGAAALWWRRDLSWHARATVPLLGLVGWLAIGALRGEDPLYAWVGTPERHLGVLTWALIAVAFVAGQSLDAVVDRAAIEWSIVLAGIGAGGFATAEALGFEPGLFAVTDGRLTATMGSAAYLGALAALLVPMLGGIAVDATGPVVRRAGAGVGLVATTVALVGAGARAAWLGLAVAGLVTVVARRRTILARPARAAAVAGAVAVGLGALVWLGPVGGRLAQAADPDAAGGRSRTDEWRVAATVVAHHPLTGVGPEGYRIAFAEGVDDAYEQAHGRDPVPDRAHDGPLDVALAGGLPALVLWLAAAGVVVVAAWRLLADAEGARWLAGIGAGLVAHLVGQLLLFPTAELEPSVWLLAGLAVTVTDRTHRRRPVHVPRVAAGALAAVGIVAVLAGAADVVADRRAETSVELAQRGDAEGALDAAQAAVDLRPDELRLHLLLAQRLVGAQRSTTAAIAALDEGLDRSPGDPIAQRQRAQLLVRRAGATHLPGDASAARSYVEGLVARDGSNAILQGLLGQACRLANDPPCAEAALRRARDLAPHDPAPAVALSDLELALGHVDEARAAAELAVARAPDDPAARDALRRAQDAAAPGAGG